MSIKWKILYVVIISLFVSLIVSIGVSYWGVNKLAKENKKVVKNLYNDNFLKSKVDLAKNIVDNYSNEVSPNNIKNTVKKDLTPFLQIILTFLLLIPFPEFRDKMRKR